MKASFIVPAPSPAWPHWRFLDFCLPDFSKFYESWKLTLCIIIVHDEN